MAICRGASAEQAEKSPLSIARNPLRATAIRNALSGLGAFDFRDQDVFLKANFNSSDPCPGSTDLETLTVVLRHLREQNCRKITLIERSGMEPTRFVLNRLGVPDIARKFEVTLLPLEEIPADGWRVETLEGSHWERGVEVPGFLMREAKLVQICNLKTHRFGGEFSASLKNSIGLISKYAQSGTAHNYMKELHASAKQLSMIAEVNVFYRPMLVVMDAMRVFVDGGPERGDLAYPEVIVASTDRLAIDAVGLALLRLNGAVGPVALGAVFEHEVLKRAADLGLGAKSPDEISFKTSDEPSRRLALQLQTTLSKTDEEKKS